ncbi:MAG: DUF4331 domain-containing protein [Actinomycetota bacterium]
MNVKLRVVSLASAVALLLTAGVFALGSLPSGASSHREAPLLSADPQVDGTDLYAFVSPDKPDTVTLISNWIPFEEPAGGPNFYSFAPGVRYDIRIDNDGDAKADVIYRWVFANHRRNPNTFLYNTGPVTSINDPALNFYQTYTLTEIDAGERPSTLLRDALVAPVDVGVASMPDYGTLRTQAVRSIEDGAGQTYAGPGDDPFFLDLRIFDLLYGCQAPYPGCNGGDSAFSETGADTLKGFNIHTTAIQVPKDDLALGGNAADNPVIGVWTTAERRSTRVQTSKGTVSSKGDFVQISRLGLPLINEAVVPVGLKNRFNASKPTSDLAEIAGFILSPEVPKLVEALYGVEAPAEPRNDLLVLATGIDGLNKPPSVTPSDELRLNMSIAPCEPGVCEAYSPLGAVGGDTAGFPNGRRLADDVIDITLQVLEGKLIADHPPVVDMLGDGVDANDLAFGAAFPYLALPHAGSDPDPHS